MVLFYPDLVCWHQAIISRLCLNLAVDRQVQSTELSPHQRQEQRRHLHADLQGWTTLRRHCIPDCESGVGVRHYPRDLLGQLTLLYRYSHKRGFRSTFDRGVLQLAFTFKRLQVLLILLTRSLADCDIVLGTTASRLQLCAVCEYYQCELQQRPSNISRPRIIIRSTLD